MELGHGRLPLGCIDPLLRVATTQPKQHISQVLSICEDFQTLSQPDLFEQTSSQGFLLFYLPPSLSCPRVIHTCATVTKKKTIFLRKYYISKDVMDHNRNSYNSLQFFDP